MRKMIAFLVMMGLVISVLPVSSATVPEFSDISSHWAKGSIKQAVAKGYVSGYPDGSFLPDKQVTRAEFIKMVVDALKLPHSNSGSPWYQPYVAAALEMGVLLESDFDKEYTTELSRIEMVRIAVRSTELWLQPSNKVSDDANLLRTAIEKGILHGDGHGELNLNEGSTRAQAVSIIERILLINKGKVIAVDEEALLQLKEE